MKVESNNLSESGLWSKICQSITEIYEFSCQNSQLRNSLSVCMGFYVLVSFSIFIEICGIKKKAD
jgi:hypothetical protein